MIESVVLGIAILSLVPVWIIGVLAIVFLTKKGYHALKEDAERLEIGRMTR